MDIYVTKASLPSIEEYIEEIKPIFETHILTNMGPIYCKFQNSLMDYLGVSNISLFTNGHTALEMALQALDLPFGGEVITTPFTFVSTSHAIVRRGLKPVFADIKDDDYTIDPAKIEECITDKTVAILPVHVYGNICDIEAIDKIAAKYELKVLYDGAHAFGEEYSGAPIGNYGDMTMFSFHATKVFNSIEGGAITYSDPKYREIFYTLMNFGIKGPEEVTGVGGNAKLSEFHSAMGICNLRHLDEEISGRQAVAEYYNDRFKGKDGIKICPLQKNVKANYGYYPIEIDPDVSASNRAEIFDALAAQGIHARKYFYPIIPDLEIYRKRLNLDSDKFPIAKKAGERILTLPIYPGLEEEIRERITDIILGLL